MPLLTSSHGALSAEQLLDKIAQDRSIIEGMIADYFAASDTFPDAGDVALSAQDLLGYLDDLRGAVSRAIESYDTRSTASVYR